MKDDAIDSWENIPEHSESVRKAGRQATRMIAHNRHEKHGLTDQLPGDANQEIAARIAGSIRQAAIGDPSVPCEQRVDKSLQKMLASRTWTSPQKQWLQKIAAQTKANVIVDRAAIDDPEQLFAAEGMGFTRRDHIFVGELQQVFDTFNESIWQKAA